MKRYGILSVWLGIKSYQILLWDSEEERDKYFETQTAQENKILTKIETAYNADFTRIQGYF